MGGWREEDLDCFEDDEDEVRWTSPLSTLRRSSTARGERYHMRVAPTVVFFSTASTPIDPWSRIRCNALPLLLEESILAPENLDT